MSDWAPTFSWIEPDLAVGGRFPIEQAAALAASHGVGAVVDLRSEDCDDAQALTACGLRFLHLPTEDMDGVSQAMLEEGVAFARAVRADQRKLLVHCEHGIGRSATLALCIMVDRGWAPMEALEQAKAARWAISPSERQFQAWTGWMSRWAPHQPAPSYHEFGMVAYRHLAQSA
jgi:predicted protein tyrosine phosphatase